MRRLLRMLFASGGTGRERQRHQGGTKTSSNWIEAAPPACQDTRANQENIRSERPEEKPSFLSSRSIVSTERRREMAAVN